MKGSDGLRRRQVRASGTFAMIGAANRSAQTPTYYHALAFAEDTSRCCYYESRRLVSIQSLDSVLRFGDCHIVTAPSINDDNQFRRPWAHELHTYLRKRNRQANKLLKFRPSLHAMDSRTRPRQRKLFSIGRNLGIAYALNLAKVEL